jgi:hypothetical protein
LGRSFDGSEIQDALELDHVVCDSPISDQQVLGGIVDDGTIG